MGKLSTLARWIAPFLLVYASLAAAQTANPQTSSERVTADPSGQYVLIKTVVGQTGGTGGRVIPTAHPDGYDVLAYCWSPYNVLGDWAERSGLTGRMVVLAHETLAWARDLVRVGYPAEPLATAIGHYEAAMIASGLTEAARQRAIDALRSELETIARGATGAAKTRKYGGCAGPGSAVQLRYQTVPKEGRAWFIPRPLREICIAQQLDPDDSTRCDYWAAAKEAEPHFFVGEIAWLVRWPDATVARGNFDAKAVVDPGIVTLGQVGAPK